MIHPLFFCTLLFLSSSLSGQISGPWHSSHFDSPITDFSMSLKGPVKKWTLKNEKGESRTMTFDPHGNLTYDTYSGTQQTFIPPDFMLIKLKKELEKIYPKSKQQDSICCYNERGQLIQKHFTDYYYKRNNNYLEKNTFDINGNIRIHQKSYSNTEMRAWNSLYGHDSPIYFSTFHSTILAIFKYNKKGKLSQIEYLHSNPSQNLKMEYIYDANDHIIATNRFDNYNIRTGYMTDDYLNEIIKSEIDTNFSITAIYPEYWSQGSPALNEWKFNEKGQKIEYNAYGYKPNGSLTVISFTAQWEYDALGKLKKEIQFDVWNNRISAILEFDQYGNVIKETEIGYGGKKDKITEMKIEYYSK